MTEKNIMFQNIPFYPRLAGLPLAGKPIDLGGRARARRSATLSRSELRRLIADMVD
jgi:hypothetical protein